MKKRYLNPHMDVIEVKFEGFICDSGDAQAQDYDEATWTIILCGGE